MVGLRPLVDGGCKGQRRAFRWDAKEELSGLRTPASSAYNFTRAARRSDLERYSLFGLLILIEELGVFEVQPLVRGVCV